MLRPSRNTQPPVPISALTAACHTPGAQLLLGLLRTGPHRDGVACAALQHLVLHLLPARLLKCLDHLQNRRALAGAQVDLLAAVVRRPDDLCDGRNVAFGQVHDVDVVADRGAVGRRVVATPHAQKVPLAKRHLQRHAQKQHVSQ
eukprot:364552-Chlamydomonas_euryale.AAC.1